MVDFTRSIPIEFETEDRESKYSTIFEFHIFRHPDPSRVNNVAVLRVKRKPTGSLFMKPLEIEEFLHNRI